MNQGKQEFHSQSNHKMSTHSDYQYLLLVAVDNTQLNREKSTCFGSYKL